MKRGGVFSHDVLRCMSATNKGVLLCFVNIVVRLFLREALSARLAGNLKMAQ